ncbi:hypothetical protein ABEG18_06385 [Alsobacter sp. KACC 23698]|uniref:Uncharacterized protein n=1 Tax=Alsobacter sp. KACC 23698 TaxID=3149229 RepID=A0AAU7JJ31_9HYPH
MLLAYLKKMADKACGDGRIELPLKRPSELDPEVMTLLANDLLEIERVERGPEGKIVYRMTDRARAMAQMRPLQKRRVLKWPAARENRGQQIRWG